MLEFLTKSKIRKKIILLFVYNQKREFYLSEIARHVKTSAGTAQRELNKLLSMDFLSFHKKGNLNIYKLNNRHPLIEEIESIVRKTFGIEVELEAELSKIKQINYAFLFGSYVKGGFKPDSDIDLFVVGEVDDDEVFEATQRVEETVGRQINYHISNEREFKAQLKKDFFHKEIVESYIFLIGNEDAFRSLIK